MKSSRLPRKALLKINGKTTIEHLIERAKRAVRPQQVVMCTSTNPHDLVLAELAVKHDIYFFRGSEDDKLDRYLKAAEKYRLSFIVTVDGDDILCEPELLDKTIEHFLQTEADFITWRGLPLGAACAGIKVEALRRVCEMKAETDTEVWGGYFTETGLFKVEQMEAEEALRRPEVRMTLDYPEDLRFFERIFAELGAGGRFFSLREILTLLEEKPEIAEINRGVQAAYEEHLKKSAPVRLKS
ncbi:MAG: 3-deoxy-manno-octulosonate cytidylyltransferase [Peptococcaceae bacterium]|nr:MAG: 3-deoxy-manno-octulosonate cytidylyltransferase [Peptococcaceae bacterium]